MDPAQLSALQAAPAGAVTTVRVASVQHPSVLGDVARNTARITRLCEAAAAGGAKIIVLPETAVTGYLGQDLKTNWCVPGREPSNGFEISKDPAEFAEVHPGGPSTTHFAALAQRLAVYITVPFLEKEDAVVETSDDDADAAPDAAPDASAAAEAPAGAAGAPVAPKRVRRYYNSVSLAAPDGTIKAHYRKTSPWPHPEMCWASPGSDVVTFDTEYGRVGLAICFDIHSVLAKYSRHKLWALLYPIAWVGPPEQGFRHDLPALLREVNCPHYIVGCNWTTDEPIPKVKKPVTADEAARRPKILGPVEPEPEWEGTGVSTHWGPRGEVLASTADDVGDTIVFSTLFTEPYMPQEAKANGGLKLDKYAAWTARQHVPKRWVFDNAVPSPKE